MATFSEDFAQCHDLVESKARGSISSNQVMWLSLALVVFTRLFNNLPQPKPVGLIKQTGKRPGGTVTGLYKNND